MNASKADVLRAHLHLNAWSNPAIRELFKTWFGDLEGQTLEHRRIAVSTGYQLIHSTFAQGVRWRRVWLPMGRVVAFRSFVEGGTIINFTSAFFNMNQDPPGLITRAGTVTHELSHIVLGTHDYAAGLDAAGGLAGTDPDLLMATLATGNILRWPLDRFHSLLRSAGTASTLAGSLGFVPFSPCAWWISLMVCNRNCGSSDFPNRGLLGVMWSTRSILQLQELRCSSCSRCSSRFSSEHLSTMAALSPSGNRSPVVQRFRSGWPTVLFGFQILSR